MPGWFWLLIYAVIFGAFCLYAYLSTKNAKKAEKTTLLMRLWGMDSVKSIASSIISIILGLIIGCIFLIVMSIIPTKGNTVSITTMYDGVQLIFGGIFNIGRNNSGELLFGFSAVKIGDMLFRATPIILTGLSVAIAFKTGLFNIGTPGQYLMGAAATLILALVIPTEVVPPFFVWCIAFIGGILAGALWGAIPGLFKAFLNVNEVITCIMTNWIAANIVTMLFDKTTGPFKFLLDPSGTKNLAFVFKTTENGVATSKMGLDLLFPGSQVNGGIIIAIVIAIIMYIIINKTIFGYQLKACGHNKNSAKYAGINDKLAIIISMAIAGGLAAAGASLYFLSGNTEFAWETYQSLPAAGFNGIPVALLAVNNPIGVVFSASFISLLDVNGMQLKYMTPYNEYITNIITAIIVYFSAFGLLFKQILEGKIKIHFKNIFKRTNARTVDEISKPKEELVIEAKEEEGDK